MPLHSRHWLPGGVHTLKQPVACPARGTTHFESAHRRFPLDIAHQAEVAVWRVVKFKHQLPTAPAELPTPHYTNRFCHGDSHPLRQRISSASKGFNSIPETGRGARSAPTELAWHAAWTSPESRQDDLSLRSIEGSLAMEQCPVCGNSNAVTHSWPGPRAAETAAAMKWPIPAGFAGQ
jgi:hypothetical protein